MNDQAPQLNVDAALVWIREYHRDTGGLIAINSHESPTVAADWRGQFHDLADPGTDDAIAEYLDQRDTLGVLGLYLGQSSISVKPGPKNRTSADIAHKLPGLWMDGDIAGPAHEWEPCEGGADCTHPSKKGGPPFGELDFVRKHAGKTLPLPPDADAMIAVAMEAGYPLPTYLQDSGNGLNGYWLFDEPQECIDGKRGLIGQLSERFQRQLEAAGQRIRDPRTPDGVKYGPLPDLARVMRLPGTVNRKPGTPGGAKMSVIIPGGTGRRFTVAEFETMIERAEAKTTAFKASTAATIAVTGVQDALPFPAPVPLPADRVKLVQENSPQDDYNRRADWMRDVLGPYGWQWHSDHGQEIYVTRPGKDVKDGHSASINGTGTDKFRVFSANCEPFEHGEGYTKAGAVRVLRFGGPTGDPDFVQTNRWLRSKGYGDPLPPREWAPPAEPDMSTLVDPMAGMDVWGFEPVDTGAGLTSDEQEEAARLLAVQRRAEKIRERAEDERIRREARRLVDSEDMAALQATRRLRLVDGWEFLQEDPEQEEQAIWGAGPQWMWAPGEPMMMFGGNGVYKSTLSHLLVFARLGLLGPDGRPRTDRNGGPVTDTDHPDDWGRVLGMPVQPMAHGTTLIYLAGDRPRQIRRAMRRHRRDWMREVLAERLIIHEGPLPFELTTNKDGLADLAMERKGSDIFVDSLKDYCPKPSEDESANGYNRARQECIARGMQWVEDHHNRKIAQGQARTNGIEDVYGSRWLTAGAGSVVSMWCDEEGSAVVHVKQVKSPGEFVPELEVTVDKPAGTMGAATKQDPISFIRSAGPQGVTAAEYATFTGLAVNAARNQLNTRTGQGVLEKVAKGPTDKADRYRVKVGIMPQTVQNVRQVDGLTS